MTGQNQPPEKPSSASDAPADAQMGKHPAGHVLELTGAHSASRHSGRYLTFDVEGTPVAQGSVARRGRNLVGVTPQLAVWRSLVRAASMVEATKEWGLNFEPIDGPLMLLVFFRLQAPAKPRWKVPAVKPDGDKLLRAVQDSLSTFPARMTRGKKPRHIPGVPGIIKDDARIVSGTYHKDYARSPLKPGATIIIKEL